ncbi:cation diffusion facilitator family transporter [Luteimonas huabeiensis]|uniref:cation diffusion facilitator family transporter n=1 Tax=Luteimonas huabeiensis TaxID=1244513 RepID=UPI000467D003|nr:cation transporter [Luteimonas huabeiensis]
MNASTDPSTDAARGRSEQGVLRASIAATAVVAALGIVFGLLSGSFAIVFDGVYSLVDGVMTLVALLVSNLIATSTATDGVRRRLVERFTMGFWHLEPMVLGANGLLLTGAAVYAFLNAVDAFLTGGRVLHFDQAIVYAAVTLLICLGMGVFGLRANRRLRSDFVALDAKAWFMSAAITAALLVAFVLGLAVQGTAWAWISPYIDPTVLALVCLAIIPMPLGTIRRALADILLVTPPDLKAQVDAVAREIVARYGFLDYRAYVARVGRGRQIELAFIVPPGGAPQPVEYWDRLRDEIGDLIGGDTPDRWLTIVFTADPEWAD